MPEISCLICTRNRPESIAGAVKSVLASAPANSEVIVVDQSTDVKTFDAIAPLLSDRRLQYGHMDRAGLSAAYNTGIRASSAPIIACTDDDCIAPADWASSVLDAFTRNPDVDLLYGQ